MVQPAQLTDAFSSCCKECNAVATMVESIAIIINASEMVTKTRTRRCTGRSCPAGAVGWAAA